MASKGMFVEQVEHVEHIELDMVIKVEPESSTSESDGLLDRSTPAYMQPLDTPITPVSQRRNRDQSFGRTVGRSEAKNCLGLQS
jgi:hypothetical protein